ncbi:MAG: FtsQ-type POTRA domain-containing protein [Gammaproteobacteria bacterium]|nr:FtsQ-type POTRA domain-containing protein [Gammaproteobacteria bacterium]
MARPGGMGMIVRLTGAAAALVLGVGVSVWLTDPAHLPIRQVSLHGELRYLDPIELQEIVAEELAGNMLTQDLGELEQRLQQNVWVRQARIHRDWPATLRIEISEQVPVARWAAGGLLTERGERFGRRGEPELSLPEVAGMPGREAALVRHVDRIQPLLEAYEMRLARLEETKFRSLHVTLRSGLRLTLGRVRPIERLARWLRYYEAYARVAPASAPKTILDLRYPNGFSARSLTQS